MTNNAFIRRTLVALHWCCRLLLAATFIFSGFVKVADPMGMTHKLYAYAVALHLPMEDSSLLLQVASAAIGCVEFALGMYVWLGVNRRLTAWGSSLIMFVFTLLTLWTYVSHPVPDCGCFGDAVHLTDGQTLAKNVVLLLAANYMLWFP